MNRLASLAILVSGLALGTAGCGGGDRAGVEPPHEKRGLEPGSAPENHATASPGSGLGPVAPVAPIEPSPVPSLPTPGRVDPDKPDATRPGGLPSEDSRKEGPRPPEAAPGAPPAAPK